MDSTYQKSSLCRPHIGLVVVWASELQAFAISLVAVVAAVVLATKRAHLMRIRWTTSGPSTNHFVLEIESKWVEFEGCG